MPVFGIEGGVSAVIAPKDFGDIQRQSERERTTAPEELDAVSELSESTKVYIFSVGAWPQQVSMGSLGSQWINCLPEDKCLIPGDLSVSAPLPIQGVPSEPYPGDGEGRRIYHRPQKNDPNRKHTGYHLAMEIIGAADKSSKTNDLRPFGLFVSKTNPPLESDVRQAQKALAANYAQMCGKATSAWKAGKFQVEFMNDERIFMVARILKKTKVDCPWLENTVASAENKECIAACGRILPINAILCQCGTRQVTDAVFDREIKRRQEEAGDEVAGLSPKRSQRKPN